jgi:hypothetical protein
VPANHRATGARTGEYRQRARTAEEVEIATMHYIDWLNHQRLFETCGADDLATAVTRDGQGSNR